MTINVRPLVITTTIALLGGCAFPPQQPVQVSTRSAQTVQSAESLNQESLKVLLDLAGIREEIKRLRNAIEEIQFETENTKRRQQDLFENMEQRMVNIERNRQVLNTQSGSVFPQEGDQSGNQQNNPQGSGNGVNQVVVDSSNTTSNVLDNNQGTATNTPIDRTTVAPGNTPVPSAITAQEQQAYDRAFQSLTRSRYKDAITQFKQMVDSWPHSQLADDAYYWMSEAMYVNREFEHALSGFRTLVSKYPDSRRVPEALLKIGYIQHDLGDYEKATNTFRDILSRFPGHQVTVSAQTRLRRIEQTIQ